MARRTLATVTAVLLLLAMAGCSSEDSGAARSRSLETLEFFVAVLDDPESFGTEDEVVDLIAEHATESALMDDEVFGAFPYRQAFYDTLYGGAMDAQLDPYHYWVSDDGSDGGMLWLWHGTNGRGNPFEIAGISLFDFNDEGLVENEFVTYPYPDSFVDDAAFGEGTPTPATDAAE